MKLPIANLILIPTLALISTAYAANIITIDDFTEGALSIQVTNLQGQTLLQNGLTPSAAIGGERSIYAGSLGLASCEIDSTTGRFRFSADSSFGYFTLQYGSTTPLRANLLAGGANRFALEIAQLDPGLWRGIFDFSVQTGNVWHSYDFSSDLFALNGPGTLTIPYSRFSGADMTMVQGIKIGVGRFEPNFHIVLDSIATVPEPSALALSIAGLATLAFARKHTSKA